MTKFIKYLETAFVLGTKTSRFNIIYASIIGASGHFLLFFVYRYIFPISWENMPLRLIGVILCIGALLKLKKQDIFGKFFGFYWHMMLIYLLPFIITLFSLKNKFAEPWLYWEIFMVFVLISFVPHWLMFLLDLILGFSAAVLVYLFTTSSPTLYPPDTVNIPLYSIVVAFSIVAGYLFNYSNLQGMRVEEQQKAAEKSMALEALAGSIAHEIRNPLAQIHHNLNEILLEIPQASTETSVALLPATNIETINRRLAQAQMAVNRGLHVINMTLGNFRNTDVAQEYLTCLSAATLTRKALDEYGYASEQERHMIHLLPGEDFMFLGEENNYVLLLYNLLVNAFQALHSIPVGRIDITLLRGEKVNMILIRDNGPGIPPKIIPKIFDPFYTSGKKGGTGLGLAFCKRVMQSFKGEITCNSEEGRYTEFTLQLPVLEKSVISEYESKLYTEFTPLFSGKKILLAGVPVEYAPLLRRQLAPLNIRVDEATNSSEVIKMIETTCYDLLLTNINLPPTNADELANKLRKSGKDIPVVAFSSSMKPVIPEYRGIDSLIAMPSALPELLNTMKTSLKTARETLKESLSGKTVLVVDDLDFNRRVIKSMLNKLGVTILEAENGLVALETLKNYHCDLLIMDMKMPVLDGFETAKRIRTEATSYRNIPILGLSGNLDNMTLKTAKQSGINDSLIKPVKLKPFLQTVSSMLQIDHHATRLPGVSTTPPMTTNGKQGA